MAVSRSTERSSVTIFTPNSWPPKAQAVGMRSVRCGPQSWRLPWTFPESSCVMLLIARLFCANGSLSCVWPKHFESRISMSQGVGRTSCCCYIDTFPGRECGGRASCRSIDLQTRADSSMQLRSSIWSASCFHLRRGHDRTLIGVVQLASRHQ